MGWACGTHGVREYTRTGFSIETWKIPLGRPRCGMEVVKSGRCGSRMEAVDWIRLAQDMSRWHSLTITVMYSIFFKMREIRLYEKPVILQQFCSVDLFYVLCFKDVSCDSVWFILVLVHYLACYMCWRIKCPETSANKYNTPGNIPKTRISHSDYGQRFKYLILFVLIVYLDCLNEVS
jgi:hypothetical protein